MSTALAQAAHDLSSRALGWLHTHRHRGALKGESITGNMNAYKVLMETAMAASLVLRDGAAGNREQVLARELMKYCWTQIQDGDLLYQRQLHHPVTTDALEGYGHFTRAGYRHPGLDRLAAQMARTGTAQAVEHVPNRRLAVANALRLTGHDLSGGPRDWEQLTRATWLGSTPPPWYIDWMTGYAVTHTVFHLTDWGRRPDGLPEDVASYLARWLPVWTDIWTENGQWDLVGELLIISMCLPQPVLDVSDWQHLAQLQEPDGLLPRDGQPVDEDPATRFEDHQHPTIVAAIAGTIALNRVLNGTVMGLQHT
ncbi:DUF6895 family protein [Streptomyces rishiriensis]|uniref:DUF6895 domain-containing protein n=1 Tax=Streptomyces rishiriensis TaxID=68264 RepID=A0ABU0NFH1_STRRH|nr:hypothetical protein [Streptomyces rishiriensis]MDQ0577844.1 hypothetical protein [Streptomyces rishiriensis]